MEEERVEPTNTPTSVCTACDTAGEFVGMGSASGRPYFRCPKCSAEWSDKNPAAVALGALGGKARAAAQTPEERSKHAQHAINRRWEKEKASRQ